MYKFCLFIFIALVPVAAHAAQCQPPEKVKVADAKILKVEVMDASKFPSHHPDVYYSTNFQLNLPGCTGIPIVFREVEPLAPKCRMGQTVSATGTYMEFMTDRTNTSLFIPNRLLAGRLIST